MGVPFASKFSSTRCSCFMSGSSESGWCLITQRRVVPTAAVGWFSVAVALPQNNVAPAPPSAPASFPVHERPSGAGRAPNSEMPLVPYPQTQRLRWRRWNAAALRSSLLICPQFDNFSPISSTFRARTLARVPLGYDSYSRTRRQTRSKFVRVHCTCTCYMLHDDVASTQNSFVAR